MDNGVAKLLAILIDKQILIHHEDEPDYILHINMLYLKDVRENLRTRPWRNNGMGITSRIESPESGTGKAS